MTPTTSHEPRPGRLAGGLARAVVALRVPLVLLWIAAAVAAALLLPGLGGGGSSPLGDVVPKKSPALDAQQRVVDLFGVPSSSDVLAVQRREGGLTRADVDAHARAAQAAAENEDPKRLLLGVIPLVNAPAPGVRWGEERTTALDVLLVSPDANLVERRDVARAHLRGLRLEAGSEVGVTGSGPARVSQFEEIESVLPKVEIATVAVILLIVALYFRSVGAPLITLGTAALAYVVAVRGLAFIGEQAGVVVPQEIEPLLVVLLLGLVTDYTVFYLAETRRRLLTGDEPLDAARAAAARIGPTVLTAGLIVAACTAALLAGKLEFFRVFGPGMAFCALVVTAVSVTLVPAIIALVGPRLFGRRVRREAALAAEARTATAGSRRATFAPEDDEPGSMARERARRRFAGTLGALRAARRTARREGRSAPVVVTTRLLASRPVSLLLVVGCVAGLGWAALQAKEVELGVSFARSLPAESEARKASETAARAFVPGIIAPTDVVLEGSGIGAAEAELDRLQQELARSPGVAATLGPREQEQATALDPRAAGFLVTRRDDAARIVVLLDQDPTSARAIADLRALQERLPGLVRAAGLPAGTRVTAAGETALAADTVEAVADDLVRIAIAVALVTLLLLAVFLRALVAPILLLAAGALGFVAALGITSLIARELWGTTQLTYYVPLVGAVLLIALGSDYNVLIAGRIREEASRLRLREAVAVAAPQASRAITVAGLTLAATFALLAILPLRSFQELALLLALGVLVDALVVRPVLIPGLVSVVGNAVFWPGRVRRAAEFDVVAALAIRLGVPDAEAERIGRSVLRTLAERIGDRQARELALHLPPRLAAELTDPDGCEPFDAEDFVRRVGERTGATPDLARDDANAVFLLLREALPPSEMDYVRAALSADYAELLAAPASRPAPVA